MALLPLGQPAETSTPPSKHLRLPHSADCAEKTSSCTRVQAGTQPVGGQSGRPRALTGRLPVQRKTKPLCCPLGLPLKQASPFACFAPGAHSRRWASQNTQPRRQSSQARVPRWSQRQDSNQPQVAAVAPGGFEWLARMCCRGPSSSVTAPDQGPSNASRVCLLGVVGLHLAMEALGRLCYWRHGKVNAWRSRVVFLCRPLVYVLYLNGITMMRAVLVWTTAK